MLVIRVLRFVGRVVIDIDHVVQHPNRRGDRLFQLLSVELTIFYVVQHVDRTEVANGRFRLRRVEQNFGTEVAAVDDTAMILR